MKNFSIPSLLVLVAAFAFTSVSAQSQTQTPAAQKAIAKPESVKQQVPSNENSTVIPSEKKVEPAINDAIINVKDEPEYFEQKKREQEKKSSEKQSDVPK